MNKTILGMHYRNTENIGDRYFHQLDYFHFDRSPDDIVIKGDASRRVSMVSFGSKFFGLKLRPAVVTTASQGIEDAVAFPMALKDSRNTKTVL